MKKVLVGIQGYVMQIEEPGDDFEIYNGPDATFQWVDAPDGITLFWTLEWSPAQGQMIWVERDGPPEDREMQRKVAYGTVEEQLDLLYHDIEDGNLSNGAWINHIRSVKTAIAAPDPKPEELAPEEMLALQAIREPSLEQEVKLSNEDMPAWRRYPGWHGYTGGGE